MFDFVESKKNKLIFFFVKSMKKYVEEKKGNIGHGV